ncbi:MAG TPA: sulfatase-like hydrolase/transferase [Vicinamibacterales bacterium]|nr:sulfatase-like hydrolase/transferase [Vicinamibacterales bacterium]
MRVRRFSRAIVLAAATAALMIAMRTGIHGQAQTATPNIVVIMLDDIELAGLGQMLNTGFLPNIKKNLIDKGYVFTESFSVASLGGPARASFFTGQYPHNHGVRANYPPLGGINNMNHNSTVATWLHDAGYRTGLVGRYVTGYGWWTSEFQLYPGWDDWNALIDPSSISVDQYRMNINGSLVNWGLLAAAYNTQLYQTDIVGWRAQSFIQTAPTYQKPFFLLVAPTVFNPENPPYNECPVEGQIFGGNLWGATMRPANRHWNSIVNLGTYFPLPTPPSFNEADVSDKPDWVQANPALTAEDVTCATRRHWRKLETLRSVDEMVGTIFSALTATGALSNTIVVLTADNGFMDGQHRFPQKTPAYESAIRVPLIIRTRTSSTMTLVRGMALTTDLAPTIASFANVTPPSTHPVDGRSLLPLINNPALTPWRGIGLLEHTPDGEENYGLVGPPYYEAVRTSSAAPRLFVKYPTVTTGVPGEFYNLTTDPHELQNKFTDPATQTERTRLDLWLNALKSCRGITCYIYETYFAF